MTERAYKETKSSLVLVLSATILVMNLTGLSYIHVGSSVYIDFSMIPAAVILTFLGYRKAALFGLAWGILSCFTHPLAGHNSYYTTILSEVVFALAIVYARKLGSKKRKVNNMNYAVIFAMGTHALVFNIGVFSLLKNDWHDQIPFGLLLVKVALTLACYVMTLTVLTKQLEQVHVSNVVKREIQ